MCWLKCYVPFRIINVLNLFFPKFCIHPPTLVFEEKKEEVYWPILRRGAHLHTPILSAVMGVKNVLNGVDSRNGVNGWCAFCGSVSCRVMQGVNWLTIQCFMHGTTKSTKWNLTWSRSFRLLLSHVCPDKIWKHFVGRPSAFKEFIFFKSKIVSYCL